MEKYEKKNSPALWIGITIGIMSGVTALLLFILSLCMYKMNLSVQIAQIVIIVIYIVVGLLGGFIMGKKMRERRFLWGLAVGAAYFFLLLVVSLAIGGGKIDDMPRMMVTMILCVASSMVGGMVS